MIKIPEIISFLVSQDEFSGEIPLSEADVENVANLYDLLRDLYKESLPEKDSELAKDFDDHIKNTIDLLVKNWKFKSAADTKTHVIRVIFIKRESFGI